ncbi:hypothetical protein F0562_014615 [Nyssa sinensis]|uniref:Jasmonate O-methyltransferase n=1 Tax=Nyssa sinensis TaxID=561372 RepID=A0A5J4ZQR1_9ASTE|nr:hypothetical protein F0562_014615 [Nyssa sinensis]
MVIENVLHMNAGNGETSYAKNSIIQKTLILKSQTLIENTLKDMYSDTFPQCFNIADLGCSSGPNTLLVISNIIDIVHGLCLQNKGKVPEFQVFLNDLPDNDFNTIFKSLPTFYAKLKKEKGDKLGPCFMSGVPGSFYGRLFPSKSLHFVHSSFSVHWLSQVPEGLENNKGNIYMSKTSPRHVLEAYLKQFQKDFSSFLSLRSEEIIPNGRMVLTIISRSIADPTCKDCCWYWELLAKSLLDMAAEGLLDETKVDSFNLPLYTPYKDEVKDIIQKEGSFDVDRLEVIEDSNEDRLGSNSNSNPDGDEHFVFDKCYENGKYISNCIRAITEPYVG